MVAQKINGSHRLPFTEFSAGQTLPEIEIVGHLVRRKYVAGVWPYACGEIANGRCQRTVTLATPDGGKLDFYVWLELEEDEYVYAHVRGSMWLSHDYRKCNYEVPQKLATHAEWLAIQMI